MSPSAIPRGAETPRRREHSQLLVSSLLDLLWSIDVYTCSVPSASPLSVSCLILVPPRFRAFLCHASCNSLGSGRVCANICYVSIFPIFKSSPFPSPSNAWTPRGPPLPSPKGKQLTRSKIVDIAKRSDLSRETHYILENCVSHFAERVRRAASRLLTSQ